MRTAAVTNVIDDSGASVPMTWRHAVWYGLGAFAISRLCVVAGAGVRAAQLVVDAEEAGLPRPKNAVGFITEVLLSWDGRW
ncbi:MAG TPA: hypothetical protein VFV63_21880, partial [Ilumatobacteraceae bacterium]|nr:hypothetical protein [Ilumatobacteraceae bacterium]